jgi:hypothetical protein
MQFGAQLKIRGYQLSLLTAGFGVYGLVLLQAVSRFFSNALTPAF